MKRNEQFHEYLFSLKEQDRVSLAARLDTSLPYLQQISYGVRRPSTKLALKLADKTGLDKSIFRPDVWGVTV